MSFFTHSNGVAAIDPASDRNSACPRRFPQPQTVESCVNSSKISNFFPGHIRTLSQYFPGLHASAQAQTPPQKKQQPHGCCTFHILYFFRHDEKISRYSTLRQRRTQWRISYSIPSMLRLLPLQWHQQPLDGMHLELCILRTAPLH